MLIDPIHTAENHLRCLGHKKAVHYIKLYSRPTLFKTVTKNCCHARDTSHLDTVIIRYLQLFCLDMTHITDRGRNSEINRIQERALKLVCRDSGGELEVEEKKI